MSLRALIVDDEPLARERLKLLLADEADILVVGEARDGMEAIASLRADPIDLLFLDIQMPGMTGLEVAIEVGAQHLPPTIFITAYQEHAVEAFRLAAVDYLTKPIERRRLKLALDRVRGNRAAFSALAMQARLSKLLEGFHQRTIPAFQPAQRLRVRDGDKDLIIPTYQVEWIEAADYYSSLHVGKRTYLLRESIADLSKRLDPGVFVRVHRSALVNLNFVQALYREGVQDGTLELTNGQRVKTSKAGRDRLVAEGKF
jgi:two-component system LytT family response regulator